MLLADIPIPGTEPIGGTPEGLRLIIGIVVYIGALIFLMVYLWWKLPRKRWKRQEKEGEENGDLSEGRGSSKDKKSEETPKE